MQTAIVKPFKMLEDFSQYQFIMERNAKLLVKTLFGESKERTIIDNIQ